MKRKSLLLAILISGGFVIAIPQGFAASGAMSRAYVYDDAGVVVRDGNGHCVQTSEWSRELANAECNPELFPRAAAPAAVGEEAPPVAKSGALGSPDIAEIAAIEPRKEINIAEKAQFDFNQAILKAEDKQRLDEVAAQLKELPEGATIRITGYTDNVGSAEYNQELSMRRAQAAQEYLVSHGVGETHIVISGMGEANPVASNDTAEGRALNRRAEIEIKAEAK